MESVRKVLALELGVATKGSIINATRVSNRSRAVRLYLTAVSLA